MSRKNTYKNLDMIEYIGPRPKKNKKKFSGGWVIAAIALAVGLFFGKPLFSSLKAEQLSVTTSDISTVIEQLDIKSGENLRIAKSALSFVQNKSVENTPLDGADLITKVFKNSTKVDIPELIHEDIKIHFPEYPQLWDEYAANPTVDHKRIQNIQRFFSRKAKLIPLEQSDYGDIVFWQLSDGSANVGIIVPSPSKNNIDKWLVHVTKKTLTWDNGLKNMVVYPICYRYIK
jgi:uncharacterized protein